MDVIVSAGHIHPSHPTPSTPNHEPNSLQIKVRIPYMPPSPFSAEKLKNQANTATSVCKVAATPLRQTTTKPPMPTRRLIPMIPIPLTKLEKDFDYRAWHRKLYGPDITVVAVTDVPEGWVLVDGITHLHGFRLTVSDYGPQPTGKIKKHWNRFNRADPNWRANMKRASNGLPPVDEWNIGVEYAWDGMCFASCLN